MAKYKKTTEKRAYSVEYLRFNENETKELSISDWVFDRHPAGYLFKCYVIKENNEKTDKIWTVWDYESTQRLKKILKTKVVAGSKKIKVKMVLDEDEEQTFEIL